MPGLFAAFLAAFATYSLSALLLFSAPAQAETIVSCPKGMKFEHPACFTPCRSGYVGDGPLCREPCKSGFSWGYSGCSKWGGLVSYYPDNYTRDSATPTTCNSSSFSRPIPDDKTPLQFTMVVASDPQYPWWFGGSRSDCSTEDCVKEKSAEANGNQIQAMNNVVNAKHTRDGQDVNSVWPSTPNVPESRRGQSIPDPKGVVINGDLTAFWHDWQVDKFMDMFHRNDSDPLNSKNLKLNLYPGLGNHDYANNKNDCWWGHNPDYLLYQAHGCAKNASHYIKKAVACNLIPNFASSTLTGYNDNSLAYSWDIGRYHFIQLHNYPTYSYGEIGLNDAIQWLRQDLQKAHDAGQRIVLNMHDYGEHMRQNNTEFLEAIAGKRVVALFAGHIHNSHGHVGTVPGTNIPVFRSGSSDYATFLLAEFAEDYMTVAVVESLFGIPRFMDPNNSSKMKTIQFDH